MKSMNFLFFSKPTKDGMPFSESEWFDHCKRYASWQASYDDAFQAFQTARKASTTEDQANELVAQFRLSEIPTHVAQNIDIDFLFYTKGYEKAAFISGNLLQANSALVKSIVSNIKDMPGTPEQIDSDITNINLAASKNNLFIQIT